MGEVLDVSTELSLPNRYIYIHIYKAKEVMVATSVKQGSSNELSSQ